MHDYILVPRQAVRLQVSDGPQLEPYRKTITGPVSVHDDWYGARLIEVEFPGPDYCSHGTTTTLLPDQRTHGGSGDLVSHSSPLTH